MERWPAFSAETYSFHTSPHNPSCRNPITAFSTETGYTLLPEITPINQYASLRHGRRRWGNERVLQIPKAKREHQPPPHLPPTPRAECSPVKRHH